MLAELAHPAWHHQAACHEQTELMYDPDHTRQAKAVCRTCPVRARCLADALIRHEPDGVWGGFDTLERQRIENTPATNLRALLQNVSVAV